MDEKETWCIYHLMEFHSCYYLYVNINVIKEETKTFQKKMKYRENQRQKLCSDHPQRIKTRKLSQPTKKLDCPVRFQVKKIYRFPKFAIIKDTKHLRDVNSKALKEVLGKLKLDKKTLFEESFGHLEYVCMIPPGMI